MENETQKILNEWRQDNPNSLSIEWSGVINIANSITWRGISFEVMIKGEWKNEGHYSRVIRYIYDGKYYDCTFWKYKCYAGGCKDNLKPTIKTATHVLQINTSMKSLSFRDIALSPSDFAITSTENPFKISKIEDQY